MEVSVHYTPNPSTDIIMKLQYIEKLRKQNQQLFLLRNQKKQQIQHLHKLIHTQKQKQTLIQQQQKIQTEKYQTLMLYLNQTQLALDKQHQIILQQLLDPSSLALQEAFVRTQEKIKQEEIQELKNLIIFLKKIKKSQSNYSDKIIQHINKQAEELTRLRNQVQKYTSDNLSCPRRWNQLLQQNKLNIARIQQLNIQIQRQNQFINSLHQQYLSKVTYLNNQYLQVTSSKFRDKQAANALVENMAHLQKQMEILSEQNNVRHSQLKDMIKQLEQLKNQQLKFDLIWEQNSQQGKLFNQIRQRVQQLEDYIKENNLNQGSKVVILTQLHQRLKNRLDKMNLVVFSMQLRYKESKISQYGILNQKSIKEYMRQTLKKKNQLAETLRRQNHQFQIRKQQLLKGLQEKNKRINQLKRLQS